MVARLVCASTADAARGTRLSLFDRLQHPSIFPVACCLMNVTQLKRFCLGLPHATEVLYADPYNFLVYSVGGKKFAYFKTSDPERWRFSTRVTTDRFIELTD